MESNMAPTGSSTNVDPVDDIFLPYVKEDLAVDSGSEIDNKECFSVDYIQEMPEETEKEDGGNIEVKRSNFSWLSGFGTFVGQEESYNEESGPRIDPSSPRGIFCNVWDRPIMERIVKETNEHAWHTIASATEFEGGLRSSSRLNDWQETNVDELYTFFAIFMYMSLCYRSRINEYWTTSILGMPGFRKLMSKNRFILLLRFLHFVDNRDLQTQVNRYERRIAKIKPLIEHCNNKFGEMYTPKRAITIDDSLLLWKGRLSRKQYIRSKAAQIGIKTHELCDAETGYLLKFIIYADEGTLPSSRSGDGFTGVTPGIVIHLMDGYLDKGHCLVMDKYYNSVPLARFLKHRKTDLIGTLNRRRTDTPPDIQSLNDRNMHRGDIISLHCGDVSVVAWKDKNIVTMVSTYHNADTIPSKKAGVSIQTPIVVHTYNKHMGRIDLKNQTLSMYLLERKRGMKWYIKLFRRLLNCSILNSYIIYEQFHAQGQCPKLSHREFRFALAKDLCTTPNILNAKSVQRIRTDTDSLAHCRLDNMPDHYPDQRKENVTNRANKRKNNFKRRGCVRCSAKKIRKETSIVCTKCNVFLCIGQCWREYHTLQNI